MTAQTGAQRQAAYLARKRRAIGLEPLHKPTYISRNVTIRDDHHAAIEQLAAEQNRAWSAVLRDVVAAGLSLTKHGDAA